jgi:hypothetical protein
MATTSTLTTRIDRELNALLAELRDLPTVVREWDALSDATRASVALDWDHLLIDILRSVEHHAQRHELNAEQQHRLSEVYVLIDDLHDDLQRLGFPVPASLPST